MRVQKLFIDHADADGNRAQNNYLCSGDHHVEDLLQSSQFAMEL